MNTRFYKHIFFMILLALFPALCFAQDPDGSPVVPDTLISRDTPSRVAITENPHGMTVSVSGTDGDETYDESVTVPFPGESSVRSRQSTTTSLSLPALGKVCGRDSRWNVIVDGLCLGLTRACGMGDDGGLQWSKSFEISWMSCIGVSFACGATDLSLGLGFDWRNYKITTSGKVLAANPDKGLEWADGPEGVNVRFSRLKTFSLQLPLLWKLPVPKTSLSFKAGPVLCFNTYGSLKTVFDDADGNRGELFTKDISPRRFTVDFFGCISLYETIGVYVRYSPMKVMDAPGLNFRPLTVGIGIGI